MNLIADHNDGAARNFAKDSKKEVFNTCPPFAISLKSFKMGFRFENLKAIKNNDKIFNFFVRPINDEQMFHEIKIVDNYGDNFISTSLLTNFFFIGDVDQAKFSDIKFSELEVEDIPPLRLISCFLISLKRFSRQTNTQWMKWATNSNSLITKNIKNFLLQ